ncbi:MAG: dTMP kinase [Thermoguttaceae bacterium]|nr:dTMP kinase [Thermoguttaceae bacterium]
MFLSIDGCDGAGKTTQLRLLAEWLRQQSYDVVTCRDPGGTALGEKLRDILLHSRDLRIDPRTEMLLYMTCRAQLVEEVVRPALNAKQLVLADRFLLSNVVYQGYGFAPNSSGPSPTLENSNCTPSSLCDPASIWQIGQIATGGITPDVGIVLDLPVKVSLARVGTVRDRLESRGESFFERVRKGFLTEAARQPHRYHVLSAEGSIEEIQKAIRQIVQPQLSPP